MLRKLFKKMLIEKICFKQNILTIKKSPSVIEEDWVPKLGVINLL